MEVCGVRTEKLEEEVKRAREEVSAAQQAAAAAAAKAEVLQRAVAQVRSLPHTYNFSTMSFHLAPI